MNARIAAHVVASLLTTVAAERALHAQDAPPPPPPPAAVSTPPASGETDHARMVGHFAVGFLGTKSIALGQGTWAGGNGQNCRTQAGMAATAPCYPTGLGSKDIEAPVIGGRYWINERIGIEAGLGIAVLSGSTDSYVAYNVPGNPAATGIQKVTVNKQSNTAFLLHAGVPLALSSYKHFTFEVIPEINVGFASGTQKDQIVTTPGAANNAVAGPDISLSGFQLDLGARVGGELHFGFIGVPELAVMGTVGLSFATQSVGASISGNKISDSNTRFGTTVQQSPFAIFTNNIAALYYF